MFLDALAQFASAQTTTTSVAHTDVIDTLAAGDAYVGCWFVFQVSTAFAALNGTPTLNVQLQTSSDEFLGVGNDTTLVQSAAFTPTQLTAGKVWAVRIPVNAKRYLRAYNLVTRDVSNNFNAGAWTSFITTDVNRFIGTDRYLL
jgi:multidrug efflux pump subunit AcrA (membrane-fusion protein)